MPGIAIIGAHRVFMEEMILLQVFVDQVASMRNIGESVEPIALHAMLIHLVKYLPTFLTTPFTF